MHDLLEGRTSAERSILFVKKLICGRGRSFGPVSQKALRSISLGAFSVAAHYARSDSTMDRSANRCGVVVTLSKPWCATPSAE